MMKKLFFLVFLAAVLSGFSIAAHADIGNSTQIRTVTSLPSTCDPTKGEKVFLVSGFTAAEYSCTGTNTWSAVPSLGLAQSWTQPQQFLCSNGECNEALFPGSSLATRIANACAQTSGVGGIVIIPATETTPYFNLNGNMREGCVVQDQRGAMSPNGIGGFNYNTTATQAAEGVVEYLQTNSALSVCCSNKFLREYYLEPNSGGIYNWNGSTGTKTNYTALAASILQRTPGQSEPIQSNVMNYAMMGDTLMMSFNVASNAQTMPGDEGAEILSGAVTVGLPAMTGTVTNIGSNTLTFGTVTNGNQLGEQTIVVNTSRSVYSTGTAAIAGTPPVITGTGTTWSSLCPGGTAPCTPAGLYFEFTGEVSGGVHLVMPVATINSDTSATLTLQSQGSNVNYQGNISSGAYKIYSGSTITAVPYSGGQFTNPQATLASASAFQVGDTVMQVGTNQQKITLFNVQAFQNVPFPGNAGSTGFSFLNQGHYPMYGGNSIGGTGGFHQYLQLYDISSSTVAPVYGIEFLANGNTPGAFLYLEDLANNTTENLITTRTTTNAQTTFGFDRAFSNNDWFMGAIKASTDDRIEIGGASIQSNLQVFQYISAANSPTYTARQVAYYANPNNNVWLDYINITNPIGGWYSRGSGAADLIVNTSNNLVMYSGNMSSQTVKLFGASGNAYFGGVINAGSSNVQITTAAGNLDGSKLNNSGVTAGTYGSSTQIPVVTVDATGRVTSVTTSTGAGGVSTPGTTTSGDFVTWNNGTGTAQADPGVGPNQYPQHTAVINADTTNTGTTSETVLASYTIPANLPVGAVVQFSAMATNNTGNTGTCTLYVRYSNNTTAGTGYAMYAKSASVSNSTGGSGEWKVRGTSSGYGYGIGGSGSTFWIGNTGVTAYSTTSVQYLNFSLLNSVSGDTCTLNNADVWLSKQ